MLPSLTLFLLLFWCVAFVGFLLVCRARITSLWREPVLASPVVVFESDDWGPGLPDQAEALADLVDLLSQHRDSSGRPTHMTIGWVSAIADAEQMAAEGYRRYVRRPASRTDDAALLDLIDCGRAGRQLSVQRHGFEHFWPEALMQALADDARLQAMLMASPGHTEALPDRLQSRWTDGSCLPSRPLAPEAIAAAVRDEALMLAQTFGSTPEVAVPNTFVWTDAVERAWAASGVTTVITCGRRFIGRDAGGALVADRSFIRNGERSRCGLRYLVRDIYFEPVRGHRANRVVAQVCRHARLGRPALIEMHRDNFLDAIHRRASLAELDVLLSGLRQALPTLCFLSAAELSVALAAPAAYRPGVTDRLHTQIARWLAEPPLVRGLKMLGLYWPLAWLVSERGLRAARADGTLAPSSSSPT